MRRIAVAVCLALASASPAFAERVIVKCKQSCDPVAAAVKQDGGRVVQRFKYVTALVADIPDLSMPRTRQILDAGAIRKDQIVRAISDQKDRDGRSLSMSRPIASVAPLDTQALGSSGVGPAAYAGNNLLTRVQSIHDAGFTGTGMKVAVIDSGIRPGFPHLSLDDSVIGGEDLVEPKDNFGFSNINNDGHGTFVAGMISAKVVFGFDPDDLFLAAVANECPACITGGNFVPMVGTAPDASIYALRVLGPDGSGRQSAIIAGMERVIDLRRAYEAGQPETQNADGSFNALNIRVANMSLGGATLFPGRDVEDELTNAFLDNDIVLVVAAGNQGPSGATVASPGTGFGSLTVGAASTAMHERILRDLQLLDLGLNLGRFYRPFDGTQTAFFSSRGPNADGRTDPDIVANGFANFGQGFDDPPASINIASGTSFAAPTVAGIAAVLRQAVPNATARQVRNALILSADANAVQDGSGPNDRGAGFVNAAAARAMLVSMTAPDTPGVTGGRNKNVDVNLERVAGIETVSGHVSRSTGPLLPGQRFETFYRVNEDTSAVIVTLSDVKPGATQNELFGDDVLFTVHSAKTSAIGQEGDYKVFELSTGKSVVIDRPETGIMRITISGDATNASPIRARVKISSISDHESGKATAKKRIDDGDSQVVRFSVPFGTKKLSVKADWEGDWGNYPANDLDVILVAPNGTLNTDGATLSNPERVDIADPQAGKWIAIVQGFEVNTRNGDKYTLKISADGDIIK
jgi:subtilisin family serine protease